MHTSMLALHFLLLTIVLGKRHDGRQRATPSLRGDERQARIDRTLFASAKTWLDRVPTERICGSGPLPHIHATTPCPKQCNEAKGFGRCDNDRCHCSPGHGGADCSFSASTIFGDGYNPFHEFSKRAVRPPPDSQGFMHTTAEFERQMIERTNANLVIEVGVWKGSTTRVLASILADRKAGVVVAVDTWQGALEFWQAIPLHDPTRDLKLDSGYPGVYFTFMSNIVAAGVEKYVVPFPVSSELAFEFMKAKKLQVDYVIIDAGHDYLHACADITGWWPLLRSGGIMSGDDYGEGFIGVMRSVEDFAVNNNLTVHLKGVTWWLLKP